MSQQSQQAEIPKDWRGRALRLLGFLAVGLSLAACGRCGDFLSSSQGQIAACHSDSPRQ